MGGCASAENDHHLLPLLGRDEFALEMLSKIGLTNSEVRKFCLMFDDINTDKSGVVTSVDVLSYLNMQPDDFSIKLLAPFDMENIGTLTFCEFTCALWNFLSLDSRNLPSFLFHLFDNERLFILNNSQIKSALKLIHQKSASDRIILKKLMDELQDLTPITRPIFRKYCQRNPFLCQPVVSLQLLMRKNVFGEIFWAGLCRRRLGDTTLLEADSLFKIRDHFPKRSTSSNRNGISVEAQDRLDGVAKARERALERFQGQRADIHTNTQATAAKGSKINKGKVVPINQHKRELSGDPVEFLTTSPFRKISLLDLEDHTEESNFPSQQGTPNSILSKDSPVPSLTKVISDHRSALRGYSPSIPARKSKSVLRRESTYLADSAEESESSGGDDLDRIRSRRKRLKNKHKKTVRFSEVNTFIYPDSSISFSGTNQPTLLPSSISVIDQIPSMQLS